MYRGKIEVTPKCAIRGLDDFALWYTPGVAAPCLDIAQHPERIFAHTNKGDFVAIVSGGTRVLGLGDIGPQAALPVMEGKALLFKYLGGVDAFPLCLATTHPDEIVQSCHWLAPTFGGFNLEDIATPKCFAVLERLRAELALPVWHDDQQGTAAVILAGLLNALQVVDVLHHGHTRMQNVLVWRVERFQTFGYPVLETWFKIDMLGINMQFHRILLGRALRASGTDGLCSQPVPYFSTRRAHPLLWPLLVGHAWRPIPSVGSPATGRHLVQDAKPVPAFSFGRTP